MDIKSFLKKDIAGFPTWVWGIIAVGGIGLGLYFYRRSSASSTGSPASTTPVDQSTSATGQAGYGDYQAAGPNAGNGQPTGATINIGIPATPSNWATSLILANHPVNLYATAGTPGGTPDAVIDTIPGNSQVQATGPEVVGAWNTPNGSELWYPVTYNGKPGFISAQDVLNATSTITNQPVQQPPPTKFSVKTVTSGPISDKPGGTNPGIGGKNLGTVPRGATLVLEDAKPSTNKYGTYYHVSWPEKNITGYVNKKTIGY